jgi:hypothetical protein
MKVVRFKKQRVLNLNLGVLKTFLHRPSWATALILQSYRLNGVASPFLGYFTFCFILLIKLHKTAKKLESTHGYRIGVSHESWKKRTIFKNIKYIN